MAVDVYAGRLELLMVPLGVFLVTLDRDEASVDPSLSGGGGANYGTKMPCFKNSVLSESVEPSPSSPPS